LKKTCAESHWQRPSAKGVFLFFLKIVLCRVSGAEAVGKDGFSIFLKIILCRVSGPEAVGKDGFLFFKKISLPSAFGNYSRQS
jgi:hypothetical protein